MAERNFRQMANHEYLPTDAGILQGENARRQAAVIGSRMLLEAQHRLLLKMQEQAYRSGQQ